MMMCAVAPLALEACGYRAGGHDDGFDAAAEIDALLGDINLVVQHAHPTGTGLTPDQEFLALPRRRHNGLEVFLRGIKSVQVPAVTGFASDDGPTTPVADLGAPISYGDDDCTTCTSNFDTTEKSCPGEPTEAYDGEIDATFRNMEKDPAERPSADYLRTTQEGKMTMVDRAELVTWMYEFSHLHDLPPGALHRAVSYVDRFLSAKKFRGDLRLLGAVAAFAAAKYEDRRTSWLLINADTITRDVGCTRRAVVDAESDLVAALGYRLSGPTAYTFLDHFTRRDQDCSPVTSLAHHFADMTLLDYRCVPLMPSAVAAAAILVAKLIVNSGTPQELWSEELMKMTGYTGQDLADITDTIYEMHELAGVWPGCAQMMDSSVYSYSLLLGDPRSSLL